MSGKREARRRPGPRAGGTKKKTTKAAVFAPSGDQLRKIAVACVEAAACYDVLAKRARTPELSGEATELALRHRATVAAVDAIAFAQGMPARRVSTCEHLRWEWFASTAAVLDGAPDMRLAREGARISRDAAAAARGLDPCLRAELDACLDSALGLEVRAVMPHRDRTFALV